MVSYHGYWTYQNIIQAEAKQPKETCRINVNTISGYIASKPNYTL